MHYPGIKRAIALAGLKYAILFIVPIFLGILVVIAFEAWGVYHLKESLDEQLSIFIFLGVLVFLLFACVFFWKRLVLSRKRLVLLLKAEGWDIVEFNDKHVVAGREGVGVCFDFDRPFLGYDLVPWSCIVRENGRQVIKRKGSYDPRYMYRISSLCIRMPCSNEADFLPNFSCRLKSLLPGDVLESITEDKGSITIVLKWGSWLGDSAMDIIKEIVPTQSHLAAIR